MFNKFTYFDELINLTETLLALVIRSSPLDFTPNLRADLPRHKDIYCC